MFFELFDMSFINRHCDVQILKIILKIILNFFTCFILFNSSQLKKKYNKLTISL